MARWCYSLPGMQRNRALLPSESAAMEVQELQKAILGKGRNDLRRFATTPRQVALSGLAHH